MDHLECPWWLAADETWAKKVMYIIKYEYDASSIFYAYSLCIKPIHESYYCIMQTYCTVYELDSQWSKLDVYVPCRVLSHSELAPLRVPLVPMEHCTSRFFQECDADKDKQVSFKEWTSCFGIRNGKSNSMSPTYYDITLHLNTFLNINDIFKVVQKRKSACYLIPCSDFLCDI